MMLRVTAREAGESIKPGAPAPGSELENAIEPVETGDSPNINALSPASRAPRFYFDINLGLAPQALCCRPLRGLHAFILILTWGWRPRLYAVARFAGFQLMPVPASRAFSLCLCPL